MKNERFIYSELWEEVGFLKIIKYLDMRNNKILTRQPTHTPRGAFDSFQGLQVASNLGLNLRKKVSQTPQQKALMRGSTRGLNKGQDLNQRLS